MLVSAGIYDTTAVAFKGGLPRHASRAALVQKLLKDPVKPGPLTAQMVAELEALIREVYTQHNPDPTAERIGYELDRRAALGATT